MASEPQQPRRAERAGTPARAPAGALVRKPVVWVIGVVVAAFGVALSNVLVPAFGDLLDRVGGRGPAVQVLDATTVRSDEVGDSVVFAEGPDLSESDLALLNAQTDPASWLVARGGSPVGTVLVRLVLAGNRRDPVRVVDLVPETRCGSPLTGALFKDPPAGGDDSERIDFDLDGRGPGTTVGADGQRAAYFPARTISLAEGEEQVLVVTASTRQQSCEVRFRVTVLADGGREEVLVPAADQPAVRVSAQLDDRSYDELYVGGVVCSGEYVRAGADYLDGSSSDPCR